MVKQGLGSCPVEWACKALDVSSSGYYAWQQRLHSSREQENYDLVEEIREIHAESGGSYGSPRIWKDLVERGRKLSRGRVERLMRRRGIRAVQRRGYVTTTTEAGDAPLAPNLLARRFAPGQVAAWVADLTAIRTAEGWLYLAVVIDLQTRMVIGWSMDVQPRGQLAIDALLMALGRREPEPGQLHHSDRGGHYSSRAYQTLLSKYAMVASMSRRGNCYDNAVAESFFASLKREALYPIQIRTRSQARRVIFDYIEVFYNRKRRHSTLRYLSPVEYEKLHMSAN
jgi:transposase InsO family protein